MEDMLYNAGGAMVWVIPTLIGLFCLNRIRKNRAEIKRLENELEKEKKKTSNPFVPPLKGNSL